ncbi:hypothetical protein MKX03_008714, partial [Papaver bracteatum]
MVRLVDYETSSEEDDDLMIYDHSKTKRPRRSPSPDSVIELVMDVGGLEGGAVDLVYDPIKKTFRKRPSVSPVQT